MFTVSHYDNSAERGDKTRVSVSISDDPAVDEWLIREALKEQFLVSCEQLGIDPPHELAGAMLEDAMAFVELIEPESEYFYRRYQVGAGFVSITLTDHAGKIDVTAARLSNELADDPRLYGT